VLAVNSPSQAAGTGGHSSGGHAGGAVGQHGFEGHHFERHDFEGRRFEGHRFDGGVHGGFGLGPVFPYDGYDEAPGYWYYCPSYGAYYPSVTSCPETWVPVPAS
jgi:hypothetical protein